MDNRRILITNDDGIESPGLRAAVESVMDMGTITVIAPTTQQTGTGRGLTGDKLARFIPLDYMVKGTRVKAFHCDCSPALIVRHSLRTIFRNETPDLLISGINYGENLGSIVTSSGTVGAALEGGSAGIPSIAVSKQTDTESHHQYTDQDWSATKHFVNRFSRILLSTGPRHDVDVLKIDVPSDATPDTGWKITKLARSEYYVKDIDNPGLETRFDDGKTVIKFDENQIDPDSDIHALAIQGIVSVTPLSIDLTSRIGLPDLQQLYEMQQQEVVRSAV